MDRTASDLDTSGGRLGAVASKPRGARSDALRNRRRVIKAASEVFAEQGMSASMADIAGRAGVGNATVYRSYATKTDLLADIAISWLTEMDAIARQAAAAPDAVTAFRGLIETIFEHLRDDRLAAELLRAGNVTDEVATIRRSVEREVTTALRRAAQSGAVRADVTYGDLSVLILGTAQRLSDTNVTSRAAWQRMARFVLTAISN
jgi:AcrR family transcriptional regulator